MQPREESFQGNFTLKVQSNSIPTTRLWTHSAMTSPTKSRSSQMWAPSENLRLSSDWGCLLTLSRKRYRDSHLMISSNLCNMSLYWLIYWQRRSTLCDNSYLKVNHSLKWAVLIINGRCRLLGMCIYNRIFIIWEVEEWATLVKDIQYPVHYLPCPVFLSLSVVCMFQSFYSLLQIF
jgi:hypothetical protein